MIKLLTTALVISLALPSSATLSGRLRGGGNKTHRALKTDKSGTTDTDAPLCCVPTAIEDEQYRRDCLALDPNECANGNIVSDVGASGTTCLAPEIWEGRPQEFWEDYCNPEAPPHFPQCCVPTDLDNDEYKRDCLSLNPNQCAGGNVVSNVGVSGTTCLGPDITNERPLEFWEDYCKPEDTSSNSEDSVDAPKKPCSLQVEIDHYPTKGEQINVAWSGASPTEKVSLVITDDAGVVVFKPDEICCNYGDMKYAISPNQLGDALEANKVYTLWIGAGNTCSASAKFILLPACTLEVETDPTPLKGTPLEIRWSGRAPMDQVFVSITQSPNSGSEGMLFQEGPLQISSSSFTVENPTYLTNAVAGETYWAHVATGHGEGSCRAAVPFTVLPCTLMIDSLDRFGYFATVMNLVSVKAGEDFKVRWSGSSPSQTLILKVEKVDGGVLFESEVDYSMREFEVPGSSMRGLTNGGENEVFRVSLKAKGYETCAVEHDFTMYQCSLSLHVSRNPARGEKLQVMWTGQTPSRSITLKLHGDLLAVRDLDVSDSTYTFSCSTYFNEANNVGNTYTIVADAGIGPMICSTSTTYTVQYTSP